MANPEQSPRPHGGFTWRAALIGSLLVVFISIWSQYAELVIHGTQISLTYPPIGAFLVLMVVVLLQWPLLALWRKLALTARELVMIWSMLALAIGIASIDIAQKMPPMIAGPFYYASPENSYEDNFLPHIKPWLAPQGSEVIRGMFESSSHPVPWKAWLTPLSAWSLFFILAYWVMLCGVALLQRQWVQHERLLFPLVMVPLKMIEQPAPNRVFNDFFRNRLMWIGLALGALPHLYAGLPGYYPGIPEPEVFLWGKRVFQTSLGNPYTPLNALRIGILPLIIGLSFLLTREISFSLWAFYLLNKLEHILGVALGIDGLRTPTGIEGFPFPGLQTSGAYIGLAAVSLYVARHKLRALAQSGHDLRESLQAGMPGRVVLWGGAAGFMALVVWAVAAGMPVLPACVVLGTSFIYLLAMTRLVSEAGMPWAAEPEFRGHHLLMALFPTRALRPPQWVATGMLLTFSHDLRVAPMPRFMQAFKMTSETGASNSDLLKALALAVAIALPVSLWALIKDAYNYGGVSINAYRFVSLARQPGQFMEKAIQSPREVVDLLALGVMSFGAGKLLLLNFLRTLYLWWPLHPVGYACSFIVYLHREWFSILIGWLVQTVIIRYAGHRGYTTARPLFLGMILGAMAAAGFWLVFDGFTGLRSHKILY